MLHCSENMRSRDTPAPIYIYIYIYGCFSFVLLLGTLAATAQKRLATETARSYQIMCFLTASGFIHHLEGFQAGWIVSYKCFDRNRDPFRGVADFVAFFFYPLLYFMTLCVACCSGGAGFGGALRRWRVMCFSLSPC